MSDWQIRFGTAGTSDSFAAKGYKNSLDIPAYTAEMGLDAFEYQCGHGVRLGLRQGRGQDGRRCRRAGHSCSASTRPTTSACPAWKRTSGCNSVNYLLQSAALCKALGGRRVIFHSGSCGKQSREAALEKALDTMARAVRRTAMRPGLRRCILCPETMGKIGQLGTLEEVLALCERGQAHYPLHRLWPPERPDAAAAVCRVQRAAIMPPSWTRWQRALGDDRAVQFHVALFPH